MKWTQSELEELYKEVNKKSLTDKEFREALMADPKGTMEAMAGRKLPDDFNLKSIKKDNDYAAIYVVPDFVQGELNTEDYCDANELSAEDLDKVNAGLSVLVIVSSACVAAVGGGESDCEDGCVGYLCLGNSCSHKTCAGVVCAFATCSDDHSGGKICEMNVCSQAVCRSDGCIDYYE